MKFYMDTSNDSETEAYIRALTMSATHGTIAADALHAGMRPPAVIVVGEVVKLRERLKWFEQTSEGFDEKELETALALTG